MPIKNNNILFWIAILFAIQFALSGMIWYYYACLFIAYPFGFASYFIWRNIKKDNKPRNKFIPAILAIGLTLSIAALIYFLLFG